MLFVYNKKLAIILIIAICILFGLILFLNKKEQPSILAPIGKGVVANIKKSVDTSNWEEYINSQLGFSIKIPLETQCLDRCSGSKNLLVPVKIFQDNNNNAVYVTPEYYYEYRDEKCEKIEASLASLQAQGKTVKPFIAWKIDVIKVNNLDEVKKFIKDYYPENCIFGNQKINNDGTYDISIVGEDWTNGNIVNSTCPYEMHYKILYSPEKHKLISVKLPIDYDFFVYNDSPGGLDDYGQEMVKSLKFE
jgi:hypothetical protein